MKVSIVAASIFLALHGGNDGAFASTIRSRPGRSHRGLQEDDGQVEALVEDIDAELVELENDVLGGYDGTGNRKGKGDDDDDEDYCGNGKGKGKSGKQSCVLANVGNEGQCLGVSPPIIIRREESPTVEDTFLLFPCHELIGKCCDVKDGGHFKKISCGGETFKISYLDRNNREKCLAAANCEAGEIEGIDCNSSGIEHLWYSGPGGTIVSFQCNKVLFEDQSTGEAVLANLQRIQNAQLLSKAVWIEICDCGLDFCEVFPSPSNGF